MKENICITDINENEQAHLNLLKNLVLSLEVSWY